MAESSNGELVNAWLFRFLLRNLRPRAAKPIPALLMGNSSNVALFETLEDAWKKPDPHPITIPSPIPTLDLRLIDVV
jgi:hypothetical protein